MAHPSVTPEFAETCRTLRDDPAKLQAILSFHAGMIRAELPITAAAVMVVLERLFPGTTILYMDPDAVQGGDHPDGWEPGTFLHDHVSGRA